MVETKKVVSPVLGVKYIDLTGDGVKELAVFTMKGVYIFQVSFFKFSFPINLFLLIVAWYKCSFGKVVAEIKIVKIMIIK